MAKKVKLIKNVLLLAATMLQMPLFLKVPQSDAEAVATKDVPPYSVYVGVPGAKMFERFTKEQNEEYKKILAQRKLWGDNL